MRRFDKRKNIEQANLMLENLYLKTKGLLKEGEYDITKNNPRFISLKFAPGGYDKFWNQYIGKIEQETSNGGWVRTWFFFRSWQDLEGSKGLQMTDGVYYLLFKKRTPEDLEKWEKGGRKEGKLMETYFFLKYGKEAGELGLYQVYGNDYSYVSPNEQYETDKIKGGPQFTYIILEKDGQERVVEPGSVGHRGYFEVSEVWSKEKNDWVK